MRVLSILLLFIFTSCASVQYRIDLQSHIELFEKHCKCKVDIPVKIVPIKQNLKDGYRTLGVCYGFRQSKLFRSIEIDEGYWKKASFCERESTVLHELAHCVLDLEHDESWTHKEPSLFMRPKSLMHPHSFPQYCVHRDEYITELFNKKK